MMFKSRPFSSDSESTPPPSAPTPPPRASVPITVYRELASELQGARSQLESLKAENQQLSQKNELLQQEVAKIIAIAQTLQQLTGEGDILHFAGMETYMDRDIKNRVSINSGLAIGDIVPVAPDEVGFDDIKREDFIADREPSPGFSSFREGEAPMSFFSRGNNLNGIFLTLAIALSIITAFGLGFVLMRPLFMNNNNNNNSSLLSPGSVGSQTE